MRRLLLTPLILAAVGCAAEGDQPTSFIEQPVVQLVQLPEPAPQEQRELVPAKPSKKVRQRTVRPKTVDAATVFPYQENRIYPIATSPGYFTAILLDPSEQMPGKAAVGNPDTADWLVEKTQAGTKTTVVLIKPGRVGLSTNVLIVTTKRTYQLDVTSYEKRAMDMVRFTYPETETQTASAVASTACFGGTFADFDPSTVNYNYSIVVKSGDPKWKPVSVVSMGGKSYVMFPNKIGQISRPVLLVYGNGGELMTPQYRDKKWSNGIGYEVDRVLDTAELRLGDSVVQIRKNG